MEILLSSGFGVPLLCRHRKALSSFLESDGISLPGGEGLCPRSGTCPFISLSYPMGAADDSVDDCKAYNVANYFVLAAQEAR